MRVLEVEPRDRTVAELRKRFGETVGLRFTVQLFVYCSEHVSVDVGESGGYRTAVGPVCASGHGGMLFSSAPLQQNYR